MPDALSIPEALSLAVTLHKGGRLAEAESIYREIIEIEPTQLDALHFLGMLLHQLGRSEAGLALLGDTLKLDPFHADAHNNLGNILKELGRLDDAADAYRSVIELRPDHADAHNNLGTVLKGQKKIKDAVACYEKAITIDPKHTGAFHNLGNAYKNLGHLDDAENAYRSAIELSPDNASVYQNLCATLCAAGNLGKAQVVLREWLCYDPDNEIAHHLMAACSGEGVPARASDAYVQTVFDNMAGSFDDRLGDLDYRAPDLVANAVANALPLPDKQFDVLDAGCGTGLCGPFLRAYAHRLIGVDLSPRMLAKARQRDVYDELIAAELTRYLLDHAREFDAVISADTLVYFGAIDEFAAAAASALRPGGHLVFTLERAERAEVPGGFRLNPNGRYSHTEDYVRRSLSGAGLRIRSIETVILRTERSQPVEGLLVRACSRTPDGSEG